MILRARSDDDRLAQVMRRRAAAGHARPSGAIGCWRSRSCIYERDPIEAAAVLAEAVDAGSVVGAGAGAPGRGPGRDSGAPPRRSRPSGWRSPRRRIRSVVSAAWVRIGDIAERALADVGAGGRRLPERAAVDARRPAARWRGWRGAWRASATAPTRRSTLRRLAAVETDRDARVGHLVTLGELLAGPGRGSGGRGRRVRAGAGACTRSTTVAIDRLDAILTELDEPSRLAAALGRYLEVAPEARDRRMRLAALWSGPLASNGRAVDELRIVVVGRRRRRRGARRAGARAGGGGSAARGDHRAPRAAAPRAAARRFAARAAPAVRAQRASARRALRAAAALVGAGPRPTPTTSAPCARAALRWTPEATGSAHRAPSSTLHPPPRRAPPGDRAAGGDVRGAAAPLRAGARGLGRDASRIAWPPRSDDPMRALVDARRRAAGRRGRRSTSTWRARSRRRSRSRPARRPRCWCRRTCCRCRGRRRAGSSAASSGTCAPGRYAIARIPGKDLGPAGRRGRAHGLSRTTGAASCPRSSSTTSRRRSRARCRGATGARSSRRRCRSATAAMFDGDRWRAGLLHTGHRAALVASGDVLGAFEHIVRDDRDSPARRRAGARSCWPPRAPTPKSSR